jgi:hypothetical protein
MHIDFPMVLDFSAVVRIRGLHVEGAALYIHKKLMDVVKLDPDTNEQQIPFWESQPIHCALIGPSPEPDFPAIVVRVYTSAEAEDADLFNYDLTFSSKGDTIKPQALPYVAKVKVQSYELTIQTVGLCYAPTGVVGYIPAEFAPDVPGFVNT